MRVFLDQKVRATRTLVSVSVFGAAIVLIGLFYAHASGHAEPAYGGLFLGLSLVAGNFLLAGSMRVVVDEASVTCAVLLARYSVPLADVQSYEIAELPSILLQSPGFPGRALGEDKLLARVGGRRGVELALRDGRRVFIEAAPPAALAGALAEALAHRRSTGA